MITRNRIYLALAAAFLVAVVLIAVYGCTGAVPTAAIDDLSLAGKGGPNNIQVTGDLNEVPAYRGTPGAFVFRLNFSTAVTRDLEPRPADGVFGTGKWRGGDRTNYDTAWLFFDHEDPGQHPFVTGFRIVVQSYHPPGFSTRINDSGIAECSDSGCLASAPYPYESGAVLPVDRSRPGATFEFRHARPNKGQQLLVRYVVPPVSPTNAKVRWYYQLGGTVVAEHDDDVNGDGRKPDQLARIIMSAMHPAYFFVVQGVTVQGSHWVDEP